jgi:hypothetical protein
VPTNIQHQSYLTGFVARELEKLERQMDNSRYSAGKLIDAMPAIYATAAALKDAKGPAATDIQRIIKWQLGELGAQLLQDKVEHADLTKAIATCARNVHSAGVLIGLRLARGGLHGPGIIIDSRSNVIFGARWSYNNIVTALNLGPPPGWV